ncbi:MAG: acyl-CoA carboxylase subunit beta, partial [Saprospiraceae bacterium]
LFDLTNEKYQKHTTATYAAARLWVDAIIDPVKTRDWIIMGIEASKFSSIEPFKTGVIQT